MSGFVLHKQLREDTHPVIQLDLCDVLLMNDTRFPWCILAPRLPDAREIHSLEPAHQQMLWQETSQVAGCLEGITGAHKMNIAALGNLVPQLHVHVIARFEEDAAWPGPVWGVGTPEPYEALLLRERIEVLSQGLSRRLSAT